jgi:hypothetical protein
MQRSDPSRRQVFVIRGLLLGALCLCAACSSTRDGRLAAPTPTRTVPAASNSSTTPIATGLTASGKLLWNFEALLHSTFGSQDVQTSDGWNFNCVGGCAPSADHPGYVYTFSHPTGSAFHLSKRRDEPDLVFGAHPVPVLINSRLIACDVSETRFLIVYGDVASFTLGCFAPAS